MGACSLGAGEQQVSVGQQGGCHAVLWGLLWDRLILAVMEGVGHVACGGIELAQAGSLRLWQSCEGRWCCYARQVQAQGLRQGCLLLCLLGGLKTSHMQAAEQIFPCRCTAYWRLTAETLCAQIWVAVQAAKLSSRTRADDQVRLAGSHRLAHAATKACSR